MKRPPLALVVILLVSLALWWPLAEFFVIGSDDRDLMAVSPALAAGAWEKLLAPQDIHVLPLYRLIRLYFDLHFPARFHWMHALAVAAHLASTVLLFVLARRRLGSVEAALVTAALFTWHTWGGEALIIKSQNTYVMSLPLLLGAVWFASQNRAVWCFLSLLTAVGIHSIGAIATAPGVLAAYYLLRDSRTGAGRIWAACLLPAVIGTVLWLQWCLPLLDQDPSFSGFPQSFTEGMARLGDAARSIPLHFGLLIRGRRPTSLVLALGTLGLAALLLLERKREGARWTLAALALAGIPLFVTFTLRTSVSTDVSRYGYQSFLAVAAGAGVAMDVLLRAVERRRALRWAVLSLLVVASLVYYWVGKKSIETRAAALQQGPSLYRKYWLGWNSLFDRVAAESVAASRVFRLPMMELDPSRTSGETFTLCNPRGKPGVELLPIEHTHASDCVNFWRVIQKTRKAPSPFDQVSLPSTMAIVSLSEALPPGDHMICRVRDKEGYPAVIGADF